MGRHWSLGLAALVQLPTCVHPRASELGPPSEPVIHRSVEGHMPPDDFYNDVDAGARPTTLRPHADGEPYAWVTGPCGTGQPHACSSGVGEHEARTRSRRRLSTPPRIYPDLFAHEHPLSLASTDPCAEDAWIDGSTEVRCSLRSPARTLRGEVFAIASHKGDMTSPVAHLRVTHLA